MTKLLTAEEELPFVISTAEQELISDFFEFYSEKKHDEKFRKLNKQLLKECLSVRGYENYSNQLESGEDFFIQEILAKSNPTLCIDVGANIGRYSASLLEKTNTRVIAFEPVPTTFIKLIENLTGYLDRVVLENTGVGSKNERLNIYHNINSHDLATFVEKTQQIEYTSNRLKTTVPVVTLDSYCEKNNINHIDFLKIDVEGFESDVFDGAQKIFSELKPKFIQIEFNWHQLFCNKSLNWFAEQLPDYDVYQLIPNNWVQRNPVDPLSNLFLFSNFVFVRK